MFREPSDSRRATRLETVATELRWKPAREELLRLVGRITDECHFRRRDGGSRRRERGQRSPPVLRPRMLIDRIRSALTDGPVHRRAAQ